jgi:cytochrome c oxidase subunit 2
MFFFRLRGLGVMALLAAFNAGGCQKAVQVQAIEVTAKKFEFSPNPIRVKKGQPVKLTITATDRDHGFAIDAFNINQKLKQGEPTVIEFTPDKTGDFPFKCVLFCGSGHGGMKGSVVVEE